MSSPNPELRKNDGPPPEPEFCKGCNSDIDPDTCWCGADVAEHNEDTGHAFVPIGCSCAWILDLDEPWLHGEQQGS
jgi:hypothetical protein